jgi:hypothetical protein
MMHLGQADDALDIHLQYDQAMSTRTRGSRFLDFLDFQPAATGG